MYLLDDWMHHALIRKILAIFLLPLTYAEASKIKKWQLIEIHYFLLSIIKDYINAF